MAYDVRAVKIGKMIKRVAATMTDKQKRREFIRGYVKAEEITHRSRNSRNKGDKADA